MSQNIELLIQSATSSLPGANPGLNRNARMPELAQLVSEYIKARNGHATSRELAVRFGQDYSLRRVIRDLNQDNRITKSRAFAPDGSIMRTYRASKRPQIFGGVNQLCPG